MKLFSHPIINMACLFLSLICFNSLASPTTPPNAMVCTSCHGPTGQGIANLAPRLAGLSSIYIQRQIKLYQSKQRANVQMQSMAMLLTSDESIKTVADFFAGQKAPEVKIIKRGDIVKITDPIERIALQGDWQRGIAACITCHGPSGIGGGNFPRLAGQQEKYLHDQLLNWHNGIRNGDPDKVMNNIALKLKPDELKALAHYFSALK